MPAGEDRQDRDGAAGHAPRIGAHLRAARLAARKTIAEVAAESGLTKGFLSKLERDLTSVSVASLMRLCDALRISVAALFQDAKGEVVRSGQYPPINFGGTGIREYLLTPGGEKRVQAILSEIEPGGGSGDEPYALPVDVEFVFMLDGQMVIEVAGEAHALGTGDAITFPAGTRHARRRAGPGAVDTLAGAPGGRAGGAGRRVGGGRPRRQARRPGAARPGRAAGSRGHRPGRARLAAWACTPTRSGPGPSTCSCGAARSSASGRAPPPGWPERSSRSGSARGGTSRTTRRESAGSARSTRPRWDAGWRPAGSRPRRPRSSSSAWTPGACRSATPARTTC